MATKMKLTVTFDRTDSACGNALSNSFGQPSEDTGDRDTTIVGATPGLGPQRTMTWSAVDKPTADLIVKFAWDRAAVKAVHMEKVIG